MSKAQDVLEKDARDYFARIYGSHIDFDAPVHEGFSIRELLLLVSAAAYERRDFNLVSDDSFDRDCQSYYDATTEETRNIANFDPDTGLWVNDVWDSEDGGRLHRLTDDVIEVTVAVSTKGRPYLHHPHLMFCIGWAQEDE